MPLLTCIHKTSGGQVSKPRPHDEPDPPEAEGLTVFYSLHCYLVQADWRLGPTGSDYQQDFLSLPVISIPTGFLCGLPGTIRPVFDIPNSS